MLADQECDKIDTRSVPYARRVLRRVALVYTHSLRLRHQRQTRASDPVRRGPRSDVLVPTSRTLPNRRTVSPEHARPVMKMLPCYGGVPGRLSRINDGGQELRSSTSPGLSLPSESCEVNEGGAKPAPPGEGALIFARQSNRRRRRAAAGLGAITSRSATRLDLFGDDPEVDVEALVLGVQLPGSGP